MNRVMLTAVVAAVAGLATTVSSRTVGSGEESRDESRIKRGFEIAPVHLDLQGRNRARVGLGSYIVNAQAGCNDCHTCPSYAHGGNPYAGQLTKINAANYLAGGVPFGPFVSHNITPDDTGKPFGLTFADFKEAMRKGHDVKDPAPGDILQVMPWPIYMNMTDHDLRAIYEYLTAIPPATPGTCAGPGEAAP